ncbi:MAG: hypothetical protein ACTSRU_14265 [Candidatus Hodarchaeales archaeon]
MRKTSEDYKKELKSQRQSVLSTEAHIKDRLFHLIQKFPDAIVVEKGIDKFKAKYITKTWVNGLSTDTMIEYIRSIEEHNAKESRVRQLTLQH